MRNTSLLSSIEKNLPNNAFLFNQADLEQLKSFSAIALGVIGALGIVSIATVAPNIFKVAKAVPKLRKMLRKNNMPAENISKTFFYLKRHAYVKLTPSKDGYLVEITDKGKKRLQKMSFDKLKIQKSKVWDGCWWLILADIPSKTHRYEADLLRLKIKQMGFYLLQRTVWAYPFDPRVELTFVSAYYGVERFVTIVKASLIDTQDEILLKKHFKLK